MLKFILKRLLHGSLVMAGVVVAVFGLFFILPGDAAIIAQGPHGDAETYKAIRADLGLDQPLSIQFLTYINDLSPISIHNTSDKKSPFYLNPDKYAPYIELYSFGESTQKDRK